MASTYNINYNFDRCTDVGSDKTYYNDGQTWCHIKAEAVNGCTFVENDSACRIEMFYNDRWMSIYMNLTKVSPEEDQLVINGEKSGITSDGTFLHRRFTFPVSYTGDADCYVKASGGTPTPVPTLNVTNNVAHTTYKTKTSGSNTVITLTCDDGFTFDGVPTVTYGADPEDPFADTTTENMTVSGNVATFTLATDSYGGYATLGGKTKEVIPEPQNNITGTTYTKEDDPFTESTTVTITCNDGLVFDGVPTVTYVNTSGQQTSVSTTVNSTNTVATAEIADLKYIVSLDGSTKQKPLSVTNNVLHTTYKTEVQGSNTKITLTCDNHYAFDGVPTVTYGANDTTENMTVSGNVATFTLATASYGGSATLNGNTKEVEPTDVTVVNNVPDAIVSHTVNGSSVTVSMKSNKVMMNVSCAYVAKDGSSKNTPVTVNVVVKPLVDENNVVSNASIVLTDVDFKHDVVLTGETKKGLRIDYNLSGCTSVTQPTYCLVGEPITFTLKADEGNKFFDAKKCKITGYNTLTGGRVFYMKVSEDMLTATGTMTPVDVIDHDWYIIVDGEATPTITPTNKYGFINAYVLNAQNLEDFATARFVPYTGDVGSTKEDPISYDLGDYISRVKRFFFQVDKGSASKLMCGNFMVDTNVFNLPSDTKVISFGSVDIPNVTQSTADYDTELNLFVPFIGLETLPVDLIGCTVALEMRVNLIGGGGVYVMTCDDRIVWTKEVEPCTDVLFRTQKQEIQVLGGSKFDSTYLMGLTPYIVLQKKTITSTGVETASSRLTKVRDVSGFTKMVNVKFADTTNMLTDDVNTIINILRNGFTL